MIEKVIERLSKEHPDELVDNDVAEECLSLLVPEGKYTAARKLLESSWKAN